MKYEGYYLAFFVFIGLIVVILYYNMQKQQELNINKISNVNNINNKSILNPNNINKNNDHNKIYNELEKYKKENNYTYNIDNVDFHKDNINNDDSKLGNPNRCIFEPELEEIYNTNLKGTHNNNNNEIFDYSIKPNKTDLPIANPPMQLLKTDAPLRLSERHLL
jgi:hypothetical protein